MTPGAPAYHARLAQRGFSLIEVIIFIVIIGVALTGVLLVINVAAKSSADPMLRKQALAVAEAMLEEVLSKAYQNDPDDPGNPALGCTPTTTPSCRLDTPDDRPNYNDVGDYAGWDKNVVIMADGLPAPVVGNFRVRVAVAAPADLTGQSGRIITVTVDTAPDTIVLAGFKAAL